MGAIEISGRSAAEAAYSVTRAQEQEHQLMEERVAVAESERARRHSA